MKVRNITVTILFIVLTCSTDFAQSPLLNDNNVLKAPARSAAGKPLELNTFYRVDVIALVIPPRNGSGGSRLKRWARGFYQTLNDRNGVLITTGLDCAVATGCNIPVKQIK